MYIVEIRARIKTVCAASEICFGEIELSVPKIGPLFVTVLKDDITHYSVSKTSVYDYMADISNKPAKLLEEYSTLAAAKTSKYAKYFQILKKVLKDLEK